jgi:LysM repeat protein
MNNQSPLIPQGSLLEQKNQGRARFKLYVFVVLAVHGIALLALLMQGCNKTPEPQAAPPEATNNTAPPPFETPSNTPPAAPNTAVPPTAPPATPELPPAAAPGVASDYKIAAGDNFTTISKKFHVTVKAIEDANPGLDPKKLQVGQTIHIPAPAPAAVASATTSAVPTVDTASGEQLYAVKSGDTLTKIANDFKISLRALRTANPTLKTDSIKVGQKLKIPAKTATPPVPATADTTAAPATASNTTGTTTAH